MTAVVDRAPDWVAAGYGVGAQKVESREELHSALEDSIAATSPRVVEVGVAPGMHLF